MSLIASMFVALLSGTFGLFAGGVLGVACVGWYHISGFEGKSGYFMGCIALLGAVAGAIIGFATARLMATGGAGAFFKGLGLSWGIVVVVAGLVALTCFLLADVPPRIGGQALELEVEIRLPAWETNSPVTVIG